MPDVPTTCPHYTHAACMPPAAVKIEGQRTLFLCGFHMTCMLLIGQPAFLKQLQVLVTSHSEAVPDSASYRAQHL